MSADLIGVKKEHEINIFTGTMADMKWPDIKHAADRNAIVLLPMGVIEEHGPHLCLATDIYTAHIYCISVKQKLEDKGYSVMIAPPFYWGICQAARGFIGSFNIRPETAKALLFDILASLKDFGFRWVFGVNAHGDVEHRIVAMNAFKDACEQLEITACFPYEDFMLHNLGLNSSEPFFYVIKPQEVKISEAAVSDVHGGDIETAIINAFYPHLVDTEKAKSLNDVSLGDNFEAWMFGGRLKQISPQGYLGSPASYESVDIAKNIDDYTHRISEAIIARLKHNESNLYFEMGGMYMASRQEELKGIVTKFSESGWDVIDAPAKAWLSAEAGDGANEAVTSELIKAVEQADKECGSCGCEFDPLYKRALELLRTA